MKNDAIKAVVVLTLISLIVMSLLAGINTLTKDIIAGNEYKKMMESLEGLIPEVAGEDYEQITDLSAYPTSVLRLLFRAEHLLTADQIAAVGVLHFDAIQRISAVDLHQTEIRRLNAL